MQTLLKRIELKSGPVGPEKPLTVSSGHMTVFVGPNHSGKSLVLREIKEESTRTKPTTANKVLQSLSFNPLDQSVQDALRAELQAAASEYEQNGQPMVHLRLSGEYTFQKKHFTDEVLAKLGSIENLRLQLDSWGHNHVNRFIRLLSGTERLTLLNETGRGNLRNPPLSIHGILFQDDARRAEFQQIIRAAFGWSFLIDPTGDTNFRVAISEQPFPSGIERSLSKEAIDFFVSCEGIETTSDGVRAFSGMVAAVITSEARVILIDEPEAFLHPALATSVAKELSRQAAKNNLQVVAATHNAAFVHGCVQAGIDLTIVRLTFRKGLATSRVLQPSALVPLMRDPLLRSTGALNGIFYDAVIVTEADRDRAFYDEVNHRNVTFGKEGGIRDCLFLNAQNWQTTARVIGPLRSLGGAAAAIVDVDIVREDKGAAFQTLLEAAGMPEGSRRALGQLRGDLRSKLADKKSDLKSKGVSALSGADRQDFENLIAQLAEYGVFLVPVGEVEGWLPDLSRRTSEKSEWLSETFEAMGQDASDPNYVKPGDNDVWQFLNSVRKWLENPSRRGIPDS